MLLKHFLLAAFVTREDLATHWARLPEENPSRPEKTWGPGEGRARDSGCGTSGKDEAQAIASPRCQEGEQGAENPRAPCSSIQGELGK